MVDICGFLCLLHLLVYHGEAVADTDNFWGPHMWGFTVQWVFKDSCSARQAKIYNTKPVCREICDPFYCNDVISSMFFNPTLGGIRGKEVAVLYNAKLCFRQTEVKARQKGCYNETLFQERLETYARYGGDPYPFRDHKWSVPGGSCSSTCTAAGMACSQDYPYADVVQTIAQQKCTVALYARYEEHSGLHQPGYMYNKNSSARPPCQAVRNDLGRSERARVAARRCSATKEGFVRLCWCTLDEHVFWFGDGEEGRVSRPYTPHPYKPTAWCIKYSPDKIKFLDTYTLLGFKEGDACADRDNLCPYHLQLHSDYCSNTSGRYSYMRANCTATCGFCDQDGSAGSDQEGSAGPRVMLSLTASWSSVTFSVQYNSTTWRAGWEVPYTPPSLTDPYVKAHKPRDLLRFVCVRYLHRTGTVDMWYKQPTKLMIQLAPVFNNLPSWGYQFLRAGDVVLGNSFFKTPNETSLSGMVVFALITHHFLNDTSYPHSTYNCMVPHLYSSKPLERRTLNWTLTWSDFSPTSSDVTVVNVRVGDRYSTPYDVTFKDVCGGCFNKERDQVTKEVDKMMLERGNAADRDDYCDKLLKAILLWEDNAYCWQVGYKVGAESLLTDYQAYGYVYPAMIHQVNSLRQLGIDPKVRCRTLDKVQQQDFTTHIATQPPKTSPAGHYTPRHNTVTPPITITETYATYTHRRQKPPLKTIRRSDCEGDVEERCTGFRHQHMWYYWRNDVFYGFPTYDTNTLYPAPAPLLDYNSCNMALVRLICLESIDINRCKRELVTHRYYVFYSDYIITTIKELKAKLMAEKCDKSHLQWRLDRASGKASKLEECSIWNLGECRYRHAVGSRFEEFGLTSSVPDMYQVELEEFRESLQEEACVRRRQYTECLDRLNCTTPNTEHYNSTFLSKRVHQEHHQALINFYTKAMRLYHGLKWCTYRVRGDCKHCYALLNQLNATDGFLKWYMKSIAAKFQECPSCYIALTVVPPDFSEKLYWERINNTNFGDSRGHVRRPHIAMLVLCVAVAVFVSHQSQQTTSVSGCTHQTMRIRHKHKPGPIPSFLDPRTYPAS